MTRYAHIVVDEDGVPRLARLSRIRVAQIVADFLAYGWNANEICREHPHLRPAEVHSALAYYFDHAAAIEEELESEIADLDRRDKAELSPLRRRLRNLRAG